ncbi:MFS transporter [Proteus myxofaciens]|uniref:Putative transport protein n=1 Tax=Proteus myxofaciens ATCC 19692 TaxID=1354337 RepID=A0A198FEJ8_9GAMM|nr:MFS transporter [Proteus myxofaciens]OAT22824.1 putative transport protein [Proteus myxofaciens ATCC 19692]
MIENNTSHRVPRAIISTRIAFFIAGLSLATWAPLIPLAKLRMMADNGTMGMVMLAFGIGSLLMMPLSGSLASRYGCRVVFNLATLIMLILLPALATLDTPLALASALFVFGCGIGAMDVVANIHAVQVEKLVGRPVMSGFHALFSIGGIVGSGVVSMLIIYGLTPLLTVSIIMILVLVLLLISFKGMLTNSEPDDSPFFAIPKGIVIVLGFLCFVAYIMEGSMLDWSGILLTSNNSVSANFAGIGYTIFAISMTIGRLLGDRLIKFFGRFNVFLFSSLIATIGIGVVVGWTHLFTMTSGFFLIGAGLSNIVPILFSAAGRQTAMPTTLAVAAISSIGYSGILLGPAFIGAIAYQYSLTTAFIVVSVLSLSLPLCSHLIKK